MPRFSGVSHISLSVSDAETTASWWKSVFGLRELVRLNHDEGWHGILLELTETIAIEFQQHDANAGEAFNPVRAGFDHLGLAVEAATTCWSGKRTSSRLVWFTHQSSIASTGPC